MPAFDGTGPRGQGPMTGRGEGYCALALPPSADQRVPYGYAGLQGMPVQGLPTHPLGASGPRFLRQASPPPRLRRGPWRGRRGRRRRQGYW